MLSGRLLIFTSAALCPCEEKKKDRPVVAGPKMLTGVVLGLAGGPSMNMCKSHQHGPGAACWRRPLLGSGNGLPGWARGGQGAAVLEKIVSGQTLILIAVQLL